MTQSIFQMLAGDISHNQFCNLSQPVVDMVPPILCLNTFAESFFHDLPKSNSKFLLGISFYSAVFLIDQKPKSTLKEVQNTFGLMIN